MTSFTIVFCVLFLKCLVLGTPLNQMLPIQTCPCNQNTYQVQEPVQQLLQQVNIPQQLQPTPMYQQPSNNNLYSQPVLMQNQLAPSFQNQQASLNEIPMLNMQVNPLANQISQFYLNRILSNPTVQGILDPNLGLYNPTIVEIPNQVPNNALNPGNVPQVVNNYFILPAEYLEMNGDLKKQIRQLKSKEMPAERGNQGSNRLRKQNGDLTQKDPPSDGGRRRLTKNENQHNNARTPPNQNNKVSTHEPLKENQDHRPIRKQFQDRNHNTDDDNERELPTTEQRAERKPKRKQLHSDNHHREVPVTSEEKKTIIIKLKEKPKQMSESDHSLKVKTQRESKELVNSNCVKKSRDSKDDAFIEDFRKKFPAIPEEVVRSLLSYLRSQLQKQQLGYPPFYYNDVSFPIQFDQLFPNSNFPSINLQDYQPPKRRPNRKNKSRHVKSKPKSLTNTDTTTKATPGIDTTTIKSKLVSTLKPKEQKKHKEIPETTTNKPLTPELGTEDEVLEIRNGLVDDYYPDFSNDNKYFGSEEVFNVRNLRENRYHYTTDRNYETEERNKNTGWKSNNFERNIAESCEETLMKPTSIENDSEMLPFRSPPLLESPDFETRPIIREKSRTEINQHKDGGFDKSSNYSDAKTSLSTDLKLNKAKIETAFGHSKVVKYGNKDDIDEESNIPVVTYYLPDNMQYKEDGTTVIVAKSIPEDHFW